MSVNVLPDMDEPRLRALGKQLNRSRKTSLIGHEKLKDELDVYNKSLNKEKKSLDGKYQAKGLRLKHKLARVRGTQKCLKQKREQSFYIETGDHPYGVYDGENLHTYRREIDDIIEKKHPKYRRQRKVDKCLENCKASGQILDEHDIKTQFDSIMTKSYNYNSDGDDLSTYMKRENPLSLTFLNGSKGAGKQWTWKSPNAPLATAKTKVRNWLKPLKSGRTSEPDDGETLVSSPLGKATPRTLTSAGSVSEQLADVRTSRTTPTRMALPPIMARKQFMMQKNTDKQKTHLSLPNLAIRRATKCDTLSKENVEKLSRIKNRRMTTII